MKARTPRIMRQPTETVIAKRHNLSLGVKTTLGGVAALSAVLAFSHGFHNTLRNVEIGEVVGAASIGLATAEGAFAGYRRESCMKAYAAGRQKPDSLQGPGRVGGAIVEAATACWEVTTVGAVAAASTLALSGETGSTPATLAITGVLGCMSIAAGEMVGGGRNRGVQQRLDAIDIASPVSVTSPTDGA